MLDPDYRADTVAPKRLRRVKLFRGGEWNRLILDALTRSTGRWRGRSGYRAGQRILGGSPTGAAASGPGEPDLSGKEA